MSIKDVRGWDAMEWFMLMLGFSIFLFMLTFCAMIATITWKIAHEQPIPVKAEANP